MEYVSGTMDYVPLLWTKAATQGGRGRPTGAAVKPWSSRGERTQLWRMNLISFSSCPPIFCSAFCWPNLRECQGGRDPTRHGQQRSALKAQSRVDEAKEQVQESKQKITVRAPKNVTALSLKIRAMSEQKLGEIRTFGKAPFSIICNPQVFLHLFCQVKDALSPIFGGERNLPSGDILIQHCFLKMLFNH